MQRQVFIYYLCIFFIYFLSACSYQYPPLSRTLRLGWEIPPRTTDPRFALDADSQYFSELIHCSIIKFDSNGLIQNQLAKKIKWINHKTLEIQIHPHFRFSDGSAVTPEDIQANFEFFITPQKEISPLQFGFTHLKKIERVGSDQIRFYLDEPDSEFIYQLSLGILPKQSALGPRITDPKSTLGCGEYQVQRWAVDHIQLQRKPPIKPQQPDTIRIEIVRDENTRLLKLINSELDLVQNTLNLDQLESLDKYPHLKLVRRPGLNTTYVAFQFRDPILKNQLVRKALAHAIQRNEIIHHLLKDWATSARSILVPTDPYAHTQLPQLQYDPKLSEKLLDQAGYPRRGKEPRFTLRLKTTTLPRSVLTAQAIQSDLEKIGVRLLIESFHWGKFKKEIDQGQAQLWLLNWTGFKGPDIFKYAFSSQSIPPYGANRGFFIHPELDHLIHQAKRELEFIPRKNLYLKAQEILAKELPYLLLWHMDQFAVVNKRVQGFELSIDGRPSSFPLIQLHEDPHP